MLYLSLQGMETIILKRDTLTKNIKQIALWSSFKKKKKKKTHFLEVSTKHFIHGYSSVRTTQLEILNCAEVKRTTRFDLFIAMYCFFNFNLF